jgi:hypothetical protein
MIEYLKGDAVYPSKYDQNKMNLILQINNDIGAYGAGFSGALSKRWPVVEKNYREWFRNSNESNTFKLGEAQLVGVDINLFVVNMIAQHEIGNDKNGRPPIRYDALDQCLKDVKIYIQDLTLKSDSNEYTLIHLPRIGAGLAGGKNR